MTASSLSIPLEEIPVRLRCSMCNNLAQDAYRLPCCEQSICGSCQSKLPTVCKICDHSPLDAAECKVYASLRTTVTIFLRTAEKKYGSLAKAKKEATPTPQTPVEKPADQAATAVAPETTREVSLPAQADQETLTGGSEDKETPKLEEKNSISAPENGQDEAEGAASNQNTQGTSDGTNSQNQGGQFWNNQQGMNQYPDQSGQYQGYNMGWNGYDQSSGYGMQGGWGNNMPNMMDQSGAMNSFNGMQSFPDGFNGMGNMNMGYGYGQGSYGNSGMGMQGQGNWGNGWNMQNGLDGSSFNSSGMNAGFYPGAGGYNHQSSYGNHQSQQNQMMPHQQFQSRGYHHNQYRNYSNQNMRGNYGQQQQFGGPPRGNNRNYEQQASGNDVSGASHGVNGDVPEQNAVAADGEPPQTNSRARGDTEKVLVGEVSEEQDRNKDFQESISSETNGATNAISLIDIRGDSQATESTDSPGTVVKENPYQTPAGDVEPQPQAPVNAPTGPRAMRERSERGRGRGRGGFYGGRGGFHQAQIAGSDDTSTNHLRTGSITSSGKNGTAIGPESDYDDASRRQSKVDDAQFSPVESRREQESHDRDRKRSRSRSKSRTRRHRHHRSRSRKRSSSPRQSRVTSRDRTRSRSKDRKRHRDGDRDKDRDREKDKREKESSRSHRSHKSSSHRHRRDRSRSRSRDRKDAKERDEATGDIDAKDTEKISEVDSKSRHRDRDHDDRRKDKDGNRDDRKRDSDKKSRKRSRSRHRSHGHHKRSRGDDEERSDRHGDDPDRKSKSSRSSRRHSTRYEDEETAAERERRVEREREEERWGKR
ncbi:hypothetical protein TWF192_001095 [Orbilia oligospora]|nr:hypothetical protein TWF192_001095 [Orbilia oligospora]